MTPKQVKFKAQVFGVTQRLLAERLGMEESFISALLSRGDKDPLQEISDEVEKINLERAQTIETFATDAQVAPVNN